MAGFLVGGESMIFMIVCSAVLTPFMHLAGHIDAAKLPWVLSVDADAFNQ